MPSHFNSHYYIHTPGSLLSAKRYIQSRVLRLSRPGGFTLTEMAMVVFIVALLLGAMMLPLAAQIDSRDNSEAQKTLLEIREALVGYAASHSAADGKPYLPCPDTDDNGTENRAGSNCTSSEGRVPWVTLGIGRFDPWNNRYRYRVTSVFSRSDIGFTLTSAGTLRVCTDSSCGTSIATAVPAVILTHGKNGLGAFNSSGGTNTASSNNNEIENYGADANDFVSKEADPAFDDLVVWLSPNILFNRMVAAGKLP
jgi:prepilin-type N-terminal cleavage/methylation domain-containing protein